MFSPASTSHESQDLSPMSDFLELSAPEKDYLDEYLNDPISQTEAQEMTPEWLMISHRIWKNKTEPASDTVAVIACPGQKSSIQCLIIRQYVLKSTRALIVI